MKTEGHGSPCQQDGMWWLSHPTAPNPKGMNGGGNPSACSQSSGAQRAVRTMGRAEPALSPARLVLGNVLRCWLLIRTSISHS